jgi:signal transduction histidine kinase
MVPSVDQDVAAIGRIQSVPTILQVVSESTGLGFAVVARVTKESWTACAVLDRVSFGLAVGDQLDITTTLCSEVRDTLEPVVIDHASQDPRYCEHRVPKMYRFESYIAVPIFRRDGAYFGTLCALDPRPARLREHKTVSMMRLFAQLISLQLHAEEEHAHDRAALAEEKSKAELREQFMAVLSHDLRNPLSSISMGAHVLLGQSLSETARTTVQRIRRSAVRIELLVNDLLDLARGRSGKGLPLALAEVGDLEARLRHVASEVASAHPEQPITFVADGCGRLVCDPRRMEQVLSNLLANAVEHSSGAQPVEVRLHGTPSAVVLAVQNQGEPIAPAVLPRLFQPFYRGAQGHQPSGLGLGLYIVSEIARSHGGTVEAASTRERGTVFTFTVPRAPR